jgi:hypothetical protein
VGTDLQPLIAAIIKEALSQGRHLKIDDSILITNKELEGLDVDS